MSSNLVATTTISVAELEQLVVRSIDRGDLTGAIDAVYRYHLKPASFATSQGCSLLHLAVNAGNLRMTRELVSDYGISLDSQNRNGETALHIAVADGEREIVTFLLESEASPFVRDLQGRTPIDLCTEVNIKSELTERQKELIQSANMEFFRLVRSSDLEGLAQLFGTKQSLLQINSPDVTGDTALHVAARAGTRELVLSLLAHGADPHLKDRKGKLPAEVTKCDSIKSLLQERVGILDGYLSKWANYAEGYKRRWFVLDDHSLAYYKSRTDYPVCCRGSIPLKNLIVRIHGHDKTRFEIASAEGNRQRFHLRAGTAAEANRWINALNQSQAASYSPSNSDETIGLISRLELLLASNDEALVLLQKLRLSVLKRAPLHEDSTTDLFFDADDNLPTNLASHVSSIGSSQQSSVSNLCIGPTGILLMAPTIQESLEVIPSDNQSERVMLSVEDTDRLRAVSLSEIELRREGEYSEESVGQICKATPSHIVIDAIKGYESLKDRLSLPADTTGMPPLSLWSILKQAIGKDLFRFPIPVNFMEPLSMLQRIAEGMEYADLLNKAVTDSDPVRRLLYIAAFAVSEYASSDDRLLKPFNPILGETYEFVDKERGFAILAEQVEHHPPVAVFVCHGKSGYEYGAVMQVRSRFWGKSIDLHPEGRSYLRIGDESYTWRRVTTTIHNVIVGRMWIEHHGSMLIEGPNGLTCHIEFHPTGWTASSGKRLNGYIKNADGERLADLDGRWNDHIDVNTVGSGERVRLWQANNGHTRTSAMYHFSPFTMRLNQIDDSLRSFLPSTDSRLRPDQRAMEEGHFLEAGTQKVRLEEKQRTARRQREQSGEPHKPRWFRREPKDGECAWRYIGGYWESREQGSWPDPLPDLF